MCPVAFHQSYFDDVALGKVYECESVGSDTCLNSCVLLEVLLVLVCACNAGAVHVSFICMMLVMCREQSCVNVSAQLCAHAHVHESCMMLF